MAKFERSVPNTKIDLRPDLGPSFSQFELASITDSSAINSAVRTSKNRLAALKVEQAKLKLQDDNLLALEVATKNRTELIGIRESIKQKALESQNTSQMISSFEEQSSALVERSIKDIEDLETSNRVEIALKRDLALFTNQIATDEIDVRKSINSGRFERSLKESSALVRLSATTDLTLDTAQQFKDQLGLGTNIYDKATTDRLLRSIEENIVLPGAQALVNSDPKKALEDFSAGKYDGFLKGTRINELVIKAQNKIGQVDKLARLTVDTVAKNNLAQVENTGKLPDRPDFSEGYSTKNNELAARNKLYDLNIAARQSVYTHKQNIKDISLSDHSAYISNMQDNVVSEQDLIIFEKVQAASQVMKGEYARDSFSATMKYSSLMRAYGELLKNQEINQFDFDAMLSTVQRSIGARIQFISNGGAINLANKLSDPFKPGSKQDQKTLDEYISFVKNLDQAHTRGDESFMDTIMGELINAGHMKPQVGVAMHYALNDNKKAVELILLGHQNRHSEGGFEAIGIPSSPSSAIDFTTTQSGIREAIFNDPQITEFNTSNLRFSSQSPGRSTFYNTVFNVSAQIASTEELTAEDAVEKARNILLSSFVRFNEGNDRFIYVPLNIGKNGQGLPRQFVKDRMMLTHTPKFFEGQVQDLPGLDSKQTAIEWAKRGRINISENNQTFQISMINDDDVEIFAQDSNGYNLEWSFEDLMIRGVLKKDQIIPRSGLGPTILEQLGNTAIGISEFFSGSKKEAIPVPDKRSLPDIEVSDIPRITMKKSPPPVTGIGVSNDLLTPGNLLREMDRLKLDLGENTDATKLTKDRFSEIRKRNPKKYDAMVSKLRKEGKSFGISNFEIMKGSKRKKYKFDSTKALDQKNLKAFEAYYKENGIPEKIREKVTAKIEYLGRLRKDLEKAIRSRNERVHNEVTIEWDKNIRQLFEYYEELD